MWGNGLQSDSRGSAAGDLLMTALWRRRCLTGPLRRGLIPFFPVLLAAAGAIALEDGLPVFFGHTRIGRRRQAVSKLEVSVDACRRWTAANQRSPERSASLLRVEYPADTGWTNCPALERVGQRHGIRSMHISYSLGTWLGAAMTLVKRASLGQAAVFPERTA